MPSATIITGASSGIGREIAIQLAAPGQTLYLLGQNEERLGEVAEKVRKLGGNPISHACDVTEFDSMEHWYRNLDSEDGEIEACYLCVGRNTFGEVLDLSLDDLEWVYQTNLLSYVQWLSMVYPDMVKRGSGTIVLLSSLSAFTGFPMATPYAASKQAMLALGHSIWPEAKEAGIGLHIVCPGFVRTRIFEASRFRDCSLGAIMSCIRKLGFPMISTEKAVRWLLKDVRRGKRFIIFPYYAKFMSILGFRVPWLIDVFHRRMMHIIRSNSAESASSSNG